MSWDVMVFCVVTPRPAVDVLDVPDLLPLGTLAHVHEVVTAALPGVDWSDPVWGRYEGDGFSFELNVGDGDPVDALMVHVRGGGDAVAALLAVTEPQGWSLLDTSTGDWIDPGDPDASGFPAWQAFRDRVVGRPRPG